MKKKTVIKLSLILCCIIIVVVATIILHTLNASPVYAESVFSKTKDVMIVGTTQTINAYDNISISPANYNQGAEFKSSSDCVSVDSDGKITFLAEDVQATITIFVKKNSDSKISASFNINTITETEYHLDKNNITMYADEVKQNKLYYNKNDVVLVKNTYNIAIYDYKTGKISVNDTELNDDINVGYDKIVIEIKSQFGKRIVLYFEVSVVQEMQFNYDDECAMIYFENSNMMSNDIISIDVTNTSVVNEVMHEYCCVALEFISVGKSKITISSKNFTYVFEIVVV